MKIILLMAQTLDGKIARNPKHNADWTSKADKKYFVRLTKEVGTVIFGRGTFEAMGRFVLPHRLNVVLSEPPFPVPEIPDSLIFLQGAPHDVVSALESRGVSQAVLGGGAHTNAQFLKAGLVSEIHVTIASRLFGEGLSLSEGIPLDVLLERTAVEELSPDTLLLKFNVLPHAD